MQLYLLYDLVIVKRVEQPRSIGLRIVIPDNRKQQLARTEGDVFSNIANLRETCIL